MDLRRDNIKRVTCAPAKLNLYLEVFDRRADGFHELETLIVPLRLRDWLSLRSLPPAADGGPGEISLSLHHAWPVRASTSPQPIPTGPTNLVVRALKLLQERSGCPLGAQVDLVKRVPAGAGLGGGSSDAAAALRLANRAWQLHWDQQRLAALAAEIGSDVPFFLFDGPAICRGRGQLVERLTGLPKLHFVIVKPPVELATSSVYQSHERLEQGSKQPARVRLDDLVRTLQSGAWRASRAWLHNRLTAAAEKLWPSLEKLRSAFDQLDFLAHQLAGSGSAYFGICRHAHHARRLTTMLRMRQLGLVYATCSYP